MEEKGFKNYLRDISTEIYENAKKAALNKQSGNDEIEKSYNLGYAFAYYEVISLMVQQADAFQIPKSDLNLSEVNPDSLI